MDSKAYTTVKDLKDYPSLADCIEEFWWNPKQQGLVRWVEHIMNNNEVMLATSLDPEGLLKSSKVDLQEYPKSGNERALYSPRYGS
jgi:hypothetical protein